MKQFDPFHAAPEKPKHLILYSGASRQGIRLIQEDAQQNFNDECFVIADGIGSLPNADIAAQLTSDTAIWAYKVVRQRPYYWDEKQRFLERIFRTTNLTLWQKRRETGFSEGLAAALLVLLTREDYYWLGQAGNCTGYLYRDGLIDVLTHEDIDDEGHITKAVGFGRARLMPKISTGKLLVGDTLLLCTDGVSNFVSEEEMRSIFEGVGETQSSIDASVARILDTATANGSDDNMSVYIVKHIVVNSSLS